MYAQMDMAKAVTAAVHKHVCLIDFMLTKGEAHTDQGQDSFAER